MNTCCILSVDKLLSPWCLENLLNVSRQEREENVLLLPLVEWRTKLVFSRSLDFWLWSWGRDSKMQLLNMIQIVLWRYGAVYDSPWAWTTQKLTAPKRLVWLDVTKALHLHRLCWKTDLQVTPLLFRNHAVSLQNVCKSGVCFRLQRSHKPAALFAKHTCGFSPLKLYQSRNFQKWLQLFQTVRQEGRKGSIDAPLPPASLLLCFAGAGAVGVPAGPEQPRSDQPVSSRCPPQLPLPNTPSSQAFGPRLRGLGKTRPLWPIWEVQGYLWK